MSSLKPQSSCQPSQGDPFVSILHYFCELDLQLSDKTLLIDIDLNTYQLCLCFLNEPKGCDFKPIKNLVSSSFGWHVDGIWTNQIRFGFSRFCDLEQLAKIIASEYRQLGYDCSIRPRGEILSETTEVNAAA